MAEGDRGGQEGWALRLQVKLAVWLKVSVGGTGKVGGEATQHAVGQCAM